MKSFKWKRQKRASEAAMTWLLLGFPYFNVRVSKLFNGLFIVGTPEYANKNCRQAFASVEAAKAAALKVVRVNLDSYATRVSKAYLLEGNRSARIIKEAHELRIAPYYHGVNYRITYPNLSYSEVEDIGHKIMDRHKQRFIRMYDKANP